MERMYTTVTRLDLTAELKEYLEQYIVFFNAVKRRIFQDMKHGVPDQMGMSSYRTMICNKYNMLTRAANACIYDVRRQIKGCRAVKKAEIKALKGKEKTVNKKIAEKKGIIDKLKPAATLNQLTKKEAEVYRNAKTSLYWAQSKLNKIRQEAVNLENALKNNDISLCFGTKKLFSKQYRLAENHYKSHQKWLNDFRKERDCYIYFLGEGAKTCGNQILQLHPAETGFRMELLRDKSFRNGRNRTNAGIVLDNVVFNYMQPELTYAICNNQPICYRIVRKGNKWYLCATFAVNAEPCTTDKNGMIGIDYNSGFMEIAETNESGNMISARHIELLHHGTGNCAESELKEKLSKLVRYAQSRGKDVVAEDLDFAKKKAETISGGKKESGRRAYNRMIHLFDYHRYLYWLEHLCLKYGVNFTLVNPAYSSRIGKQKYAGPRKMTVHRAAALVIARRGQGYKDELKQRKQVNGKNKAG